MYLLLNSSFYTKEELPLVFNRINAIRENTGSYFETKTYPELLYGLCFIHDGNPVYKGGCFGLNGKSTGDWKSDCDQADLIIRGLMPVFMVDDIVKTPDLLKSLGLTTQQVQKICGTYSILSGWKKY